MSWTGRTGWTGRRATAALAGLALGATTLLAVPPPAPAQVEPDPTASDTLVFVGLDGPSAFYRNHSTATVPLVPPRDAVLEGDFSAAPGTDLFLHGAGSAQDSIVHVAPTGTGTTVTVRTETVGGSYPQAFVGDFDGNGLDDIFWYGGGKAAPDSIWLFQPDGSHTTVWTNVTGHFLPVVLDADGDGDDDVIWYGYGKAYDSMWLFGPGATVTKRSVRIDGGYEPLVGRFGGVPDDGPQEQVLWYAHLGPDSVWTFTATGKVSRPLPNEDGAIPVVGDFAANHRDAVFWYRPGSGRETSTGFVDGGAPIQIDMPQVTGDYEPVVADFDGNGNEDIAWTWSGKAIIWTSNPSLLQHGELHVDTGRNPSIAAVTRPTTNVD